MEHFEAVCKAQITDSLPQQQQNASVNQHVGKLSVWQARAPRSKELHMCIKTQPVSAAGEMSLAWLPDISTDVDVLGQEGLHHLRSRSQELKPEAEVVQAMDSGDLGTLVTFTATISLRDQHCETTVHVFQRLYTPPLSRSLCIQLGLLDCDWPFCQLPSANTVNIQ